jgi:hypothetical protein
VLLCVVSSQELASSIHSIYVLHVPNKFNLCILHVGTCNKTLALEKEKTLTYLHLQMMMTTVIQTEKAEVVKYLVRAMRYYKDKKEMLIVPYNTGSHWVVITISMRYNQVWYCDSNRPTDPVTGKRGTRDYSEVMGVLNE